MRRLPLFPLTLVLYPGAVVPLHIFEPRYRRMVARCLEYDRRFGIIFHDPDRFGPFLLEEGRVGSVAKILHFKILPEGRSLIVVRGLERFTIRDGIESTEPYFEALVSAYEDAVDYDGSIIERRRRSVDLFRTVLSCSPRRPETIPEIDPAEEVSFRLAKAVVTDGVWQQNLLEMRDERKRLDRLDSVFLGAIADWKAPSLDPEEG